MSMTEKRVTLITSVGSALEYYDFITYILLASYLSQVFFPESDPIAGSLETLAVFAIAYIARPVGGLIFGHFGDKFGRKKVFLASILLMAASTFAIGLLPSYHAIGVLGAILLVVLRTIQGLSQGAELPGAITFIAEHASRTKRGSQLGLMMFGVALGAMLSTLVNLILHYNLDTAQFITWGWRIPFLIGGVLAIVGFYLRRSIPESPIFIDHKDTLDEPLPEAQVQRFFKIMNLCLLVLLGIAGFYVLSMIYTFQARLPSWNWLVNLGEFFILVALVYGVYKWLVNWNVYINFRAGLVKEPFSMVISSQHKPLLQGIGITIFPASFILFALFLPSYLDTYYTYSSTHVYLAMTLSLLWSALLLPLFGWFSDFIGRKRLFISAAIIAIVTIYSLFQLLTFGEVANVYGFMFLYQTIVAMLAACYPSQLAELFTTKVRYTGVGICYNVSFCIAAFIPMLAVSLLSLTHYRLVVSFIFIILGILSLITVWTTYERSNRQLKAN